MTYVHEESRLFSSWEKPEYPNWSPMPGEKFLNLGSKSVGVVLFLCVLYTCVNLIKSKWSSPNACEMCSLHIYTQTRKKWDYFHAWITKVSQFLPIKYWSYGWNVPLSRFLWLATYRSLITWLRCGYFKLEYLCGSFKGTLQLVRQELPCNGIAAEYPQSHCIYTTCSSHGIAPLYDTYIAGHRNLYVYVSLLSCVKMF